MGTKTMFRKLQALQAEDGSESGGGGYQTTVDQTGQEAAGEESPAQGEDWSDYIGDEAEDSSFETEEGTESAGEEETPATADGEESEAPAEEKTDEQPGEEDTGKEEQPEEEPEEKSEEERREEQRNIWENYEQAKKEAQDKLAEQYDLTDEQADQLLENPREVLPQLLSKMYTDVFEDVMNAVQANFPTLMQQHEQQSQRKEQAENEFYSRWPNLRGYEDTVDRIAATYRAQNQNVSREQFIQDVGAQASWAVGKPPAEDKEEEQPAQPHKPAAPGARGGAPSGPSSGREMGFEEQEEIE